MSKIDRETRKKALREDHNNVGKSDRSWYLVDNIEEKFGVKNFTPAEGNVFLAFLERWEDPKFYLELFVHYNIGSDNHAFLCLDKMYGEQCPICAYREELKSSGEPEDIYNEYRWTKRYLMWVVNAETKRTIKEGPMIYDAPGTVRNEILDACVDPRNGEIIDPSDPDEKVNIVFKRKGKTKNNTKYSAFQLEEREDEIPKEFYDLPEMKELLLKPEVSDIRKVLGFSSRGQEEKHDTPQRSRFRKDIDTDEVGKDEEENKEERKHGFRFKKNEDDEEQEEKPRKRLSKKEDIDDENDTPPFDREKYKKEDDEEKEKQEVSARVRNRLKRR